jgi:hypothetical protein
MPYDLAFCYAADYTDYFADNYEMMFGYENREEGWGHYDYEEGIGYNAEENWRGTSDVLPF